MDILRLAAEFKIEPRRVREAIEQAKELIDAARSDIRPAGKQAVRGIAESLEGIIARLNEPSVRERLIETTFEEFGGPLKDDYSYARGVAWFNAHQRLGKAMAGLGDLLEIVQQSNSAKLPAGRPGYEAWTAGVVAIMGLWQCGLNREITISDHPNDSRGAKPSEALRFTHECLKLAGEDITLQACRTVLQNLKDGKVDVYNRNYLQNSTAGPSEK